MKLGCDCRKHGMGQKGDSGFNPLWFLLGAGAGVGVWLLLRNAGRTGPGETVAAPLPTVAPPSRYADLRSVAARLDQVKTLYRGGYFSPEQALAETESLLVAAYNFTSTDGSARVNDVAVAIQAFQKEIVDYMKFRGEPIPSVTGAPRVSSFA